MLERSGIPREIALSAKLRRVSSEEGKRIVDRHDSGDYSGIVFPNYWPGEAGVRDERLRLDNPQTVIKHGKQQPTGKYLSAPGRSNTLYAHRDTDPTALPNTSRTLYFVEGQKKALALYSHLQKIGSDAIVFGLNGVWGARGKIGIQSNSKGQRQAVKGVIPDIDRIALDGRKVVILFDTNVDSNSGVAAARNELALELVSRGAHVSLIDMQPEDGINGIDDFIGKHGTAAAETLLATARAFDPSEKISKLPFTDADNETVFELLFGDAFYFNVTARQWLKWDAPIWKPDSLNAADRAMLDVARARLDATAKKATEEQRTKAAGEALKLRNVRGRKAALESATSNPRFARTAESFDHAEHLFACADGVIDLRTGDYRPGRRTDMLTKSTRVKWNPGASRSAWITFLQGVFPDNPAMLEFLQRAVGYSLTGSTREEVFFILHGTGRNGKGTFMRVLSEVFGDYAGTCEFSTLLQGKDSRAPRNDIAAMAGKRFIAAQESREGARLDEALVKTLTGGDLITARYLHQEFFTFKPTWKIWVATNHKPDIQGTDTGIWSRPRLIPFNVSFEGREDKNLKPRLLSQESLSGVLAWAVEGCLAYLKDGELKYPETVLRATAEYRAEADQVQRFIDECCSVADGLSSFAGPLYKAFTRWAGENGEKDAISQTAFGLRMVEKGFRKDRASGKGSRYSGVGLHATDRFE